MMAQAFVDFLFILLMVVANGFFVAAEFAIVKVRSSQITQKIKAGHRRATLAKNIVEHLDAYLSATQLGITLTSLGLGLPSPTSSPQAIASIRSSTPRTAR